MRTGRHREVKRVRTILRAASTGRLLLGEFKDWQEFLQPDTHDFLGMPRRQLRALDKDANRRLRTEIEKYCAENFEGMSIAALCKLFEALKAHRGLEMPRHVFELRYARFLDNVVSEIPQHGTVVISLWGLQFWFPEDGLSKDLALALADAGAAMRSLESYFQSHHSALLERRAEIRDLMRRRRYAARSGLLAAFNLIECHMNSLAWGFLQSNSETSMSNRQRALLSDAAGTTLRKKLLRYPEIVSRRPMSAEMTNMCEGFLSVVKPFRDSLVHPSPFEAPERFGGYDKLRMLYRVDVDTLFLAAQMLIDLVDLIQSHLDGEASSTAWLERVRVELQENATPTPPEWMTSRHWCQQD